jgi:hypothetical protein
LLRLHFPAGTKTPLLKPHCWLLPLCAAVLLLLLLL